LSAADFGGDVAVLSSADLKSNFLYVSEYNVLPSNGGGLIKLDSNASEILVTNFLH
jgi:hypothetical protein